MLVAFCHFTNGRETFLEPSWYKDLLWHGRIGVQIFFVISGFVITHSLATANYQLGDFFRFVAKRVVRLEPVYLLVVAYLIFRAWLASRQIDWTAALLHLGYLVPFFHKAWLTIIFWTLEIEFQFYILFGLIFPSLLRGSRAFVNTMLSLFALCCLIQTDPNFLFHWAPFFLLGIVCSLIHLDLIRRLDAACLITLATILAFATETPTKAGAGILAAVGIFTLTGTTRFTTFFADISYSLYLIHVPVGLGVIGIAQKMRVDGFGKFLAILAAWAASTVAAWALWKFVEEPSRKLSSRLPLKARSAV